MFGLSIWSVFLGRSLHPPRNSTSFNHRMRKEEKRKSYHKTWITLCPRRDSSNPFLAAVREIQVQRSDHPRSIRFQGTENVPICTGNIQCVKYSLFFFKEKKICTKSWTRQESSYWDTEWWIENITVQMSFRVPGWLDYIPDPERTLDWNLI